MSDQKKFPRIIQIVWNDETQYPEIIPVDVISHNQESAFYALVEGKEDMDDVVGDFPATPPDMEGITQ